GRRRWWPGSGGGGLVDRSGRERLGETRNGSRLVRGSEVAVAQRHLERLVTEQVLHRPQIDPGHHQMTREGVAQVVPVEVGDAGGTAGPAEGGVERRVAPRAPPGRAGTGVPNP